MSDQKIKTAAKKAPLGLVPAQALVGPARVFEYGARKYAPGNYYNATLADGAGPRYVSAALRHLAEMQTASGLHTSMSLSERDPESGLPHIDHVLCGLMMLRSILAKEGVLPVDPGLGKEPPYQMQSSEALRDENGDVLMETTCPLEELDRTECEGDCPRGTTHVDGMRLLRLARQVAGERNW